MFGKVMEIGSVQWSLPRMGLIFSVLVETILGFMKVFPKRGIENFELLVSGQTSVLWGRVKGLRCLGEEPPGYFISPLEASKKLVSEEK